MNQLAHDTASTYLTIRLDNQLLGLAVVHVRDVLTPRPITRVPLAPPEVRGVLNLRGRVVTVIDLRGRLGLPPRAPEDKYMFVVVEVRGELYSLEADRVGEVMHVPPAQTERPPANLDDHWKGFATGICTLEQELLVLVDVLKLLDY